MKPTPPESIPDQPASTSTAGARHIDLGQKAGGEWVMVVEDDEATRLMTCVTLERAGYRTLEAADCATARAVLEKHRPDIMLLDALLPDGDGFSFCREVQDSPRGRDIPVAMVTGLDDVASIHRAYQSGATDFITKPVSWGTLPHRIQFILRASRAFHELSISEGKTRALLAGIPDIILRLHHTGQVLDMQVGTYVNDMEEWVSYDKNGEGHLPCPVYRTLAQPIARVFSGEGEQLVEFDWTEKDRVRIWEARLILRERDEIVMVVRDITRRKQQESELRLWSKAFETSNEAIIITDEKLRIILVNRTYEKIMGYTQGEVLGVDTVNVGIQLHSHSFFRNLLSVLKEQGYWQGELINRRKNGERFPTWYSISQVLDAAGKTENYIAIFSDISERKKSRARLDFLAHHDSLTHLPNRALLNDRLERAINTAKRRGEKVGVLFIDLDRFKNVNDSLGHAAGDQILCQTAARLTDAVRIDDTVARLGGDEFVVLLPRVHDERSLAEVAIKVQEEVLKPFTVEDMPLHLSPSIGIAVYPEDGETPDTLIRNADAAMYLAKEKGRNNYQFYTPILNARTLDRLKLEYDLRTALELGQFELHYQPQIDVRSRRVYGAEALVRWRHPERGLVAPNQFIPLAEETALIIPLGAWVIAEAARQSREWQEAGLGNLIVGVNISALQFHQASFLEDVQKFVANAGASPGSIELELTESILMSEMDTCIQTLNTFRDLGYRVSIDDFGTGFSSLNYLRRLPVNLLKIDQSFVRDMRSDNASLAIVNSIINLANSLGMETIAEGVETREECDVLAEQGCYQMQGYHFSKPLPQAQFRQWLAGWDQGN